MMTPEENTLITALFDRLSQSSTQYRDAEAERLILAKVAENPHAPYQLAQSTIVLQQAVTSAQSRIAALEKQLAESSSQSPGSGSFLSGVANLFSAPQTAPIRPVTQSPPPIPMQQAPQGGGFLQTALSTAAGVAGGALLFQGIENLLGHNPGPFSGMGGLGGVGGGQPVTEITNNYFDDPSAGSLGASGINPQIPPIDPGVDFNSLNAPNTDPSFQDDFAFNNPEETGNFGLGNDGDFFGGDDSSSI
jgi:hypothetical protein